MDHLATTFPSSAPRTTNTAAAGSFVDGLHKSAAHLLRRIFDDLALPEPLQARLLGLSSSDAAALAAFQIGRGSLPPAARVMASNMLAISQDLVILFPERADRRAWMRERGAMFDGRAPIDLLQDGGSDAVVGIARRLHGAKRGQEFVHVHRPARPVADSVPDGQRSEGISGGVEL